MADTRTILIDYGHIDSTLYKAALTHDLLEDLEDFDVNLLIYADAEGPEVYKLVLEVTKKRGESKIEFLTRIMEQGSRKAKLIKCADRISNLKDIGFYSTSSFIKRYCDETEAFILPMAREVDQDMYLELADLIKSRRNFLRLFKEVIMQEP